MEPEPLLFLFTERNMDPGTPKTPVRPVELQRSTHDDGRAFAAVAVETAGQIDCEHATGSLVDCCDDCREGLSQ